MILLISFDFIINNLNYKQRVVHFICILMTSSTAYLINLFITNLVMSILIYVY
jgi:hypothetical protein